MNRFSTYLLCLLLLVSSFPSNAYTCMDQMQHQDSQENHNQIQSSNVSEHSFGMASNCHEQIVETAHDESQQSDTEQNCCDEDCASCLHLNVYLGLSDIVLSNIKTNQRQKFRDNFANITLGIITPPPIA